MIGVERVPIERIRKCTGRNLRRNGVGAVGGLFGMDRNALINGGIGRNHDVGRVKLVSRRNLHDELAMFAIDPFNARVSVQRRSPTLQGTRYSGKIFGGMEACLARKA